MSYPQITEPFGPDGKPTSIGGIGDHLRFADTTHQPETSLSQPTQTSRADDSTTIPPNSLAGLPSELVQHIGNFVGAKEVATLSMTNRGFREFFSSDVLRAHLKERSPLFVTYFLDKVFATGEVFDSKTYGRIEAEYGWLLNILPREASDLSDLIQKMTAPMPTGTFNDFKQRGKDAPDPKLFIDWLKKHKIFYQHANTYRQLRRLLGSIDNDLAEAVEREAIDPSENSQTFTQLNDYLTGKTGRFDRELLTQIENNILKLIVDLEPDKEKISKSDLDIIEQELRILLYTRGLLTNYPPKRLVSSQLVSKLIEKSPYDPDSLIQRILHVHCNKHEFILLKAKEYLDKKNIDGLRAYIQDLGGVEKLIPEIVNFVWFNLKDSKERQAFYSGIIKAMLATTPINYLPHSILLRLKKSYDENNHDAFYRELSAFGHVQDALFQLNNYKQNCDPMLKLGIIDKESIESAISTCKEILNANGVMSIEERPSAPPGIIKTYTHANRWRKKTFYSLDESLFFEWSFSEIPLAAFAPLGAIIDYLERHHQELYRRIDNLFKRYPLLILPALVGFFLYSVLAFPVALAVWVLRPILNLTLKTAITLVGISKFTTDLTTQLIKDLLGKHILSVFKPRHSNEQYRDFIPPSFINTHQSYSGHPANYTSQIFSAPKKTIRSIRNCVRHDNAYRDGRELQFQCLSLLFAPIRPIYHLLKSVIQAIIPLLLAPFMNDALFVMKASLMNSGCLFLQACVELITLPLQLLTHLCLVPVYLLRLLNSHDHESYLAKHDINKSRHYPQGRSMNMRESIQRHCRTIDSLTKTDDINELHGQQKIDKLNEKIRDIRSTAKKISSKKRRGIEKDGNFNSGIYQKLTARPLLMFAPIQGSGQNTNCLSMTRKIQLAQQQFKSVTEDAQAYIRSFGYRAARAA